MKIVRVSYVNSFGKTDAVKEAPNEIVSNLSEIYSSEQGKLINTGNFDVSGIDLSGDLKEDNDLIYKEALENFGKKLFFIGGDHSVSYPLCRSFFDYTEYNGREPALIVFDSHPDCMKSIDSNVPTNEGWLRFLIEDGFNPKNILLVGVRNSDVSELIFLKEKGVKVFSVDEFLFDLEGKVDAIMEFGYSKDVYVSIDIDCIDPAFAPGVSCCEPGGLTSRQFLYIMKRMSRMKNLRAMDLVEVNPSRDVNRMTSKLGAKILGEFL
jgi:arginase family enzyme